MYGYAYSTSKDGLWINLYGSNTLNSHLPDGTAVRTTQDSNYPWDDKIKLTIHSSHRKAFALKLRIPNWANEAHIRVNGKTVKKTIIPGEYVTLKQPWTAGDAVVLSLPMKVRLMKANPLVEELQSQVAVMRGPLLYCLESVDLPNGVNIMDVLLPRNMLGGVTVLEGKALFIKDKDWSIQPYGAEPLYKEIGDINPQSFQLRLIPYYAWSNRGVSQMTVWVPFN